MWKKWSFYAFSDDITNKPTRKQKKDLKKKKIQESNRRYKNHLPTIKTTQFTFLTHEWNTWHPRNGNKESNKKKWSQINPFIKDKPFCCQTYTHIQFPKMPENE